MQANLLSSRFTNNFPLTMWTAAGAGICSSGDKQMASGGVA